MMFRRLHDDVTEIKETLSTIVKALIASDPRTSLSADAYDGLRRQVLAASTDRRRHLVQLVQMRDAVDRGTSHEDLRMLLDRWFEQAGLQPWDRAEPAEFFDVLDDGGQPDGVLRPAWVTGDPPALVVRGLRNRRHDADAAGADDLPDAEPAPALVARDGDDR